MNKMHRALVIVAAASLAGLQVRAENTTALLIAGAEIQAQASAICASGKDAVYAASGTSVIQYNSKGEKLNTWALPGAARYIAAIAVDTDGAIYVCGNKENSIVLFRVEDKDKKIAVKEWPVEGLRAATGMKANNGVVYIANSMGRCIHTIDTKTGKVDAIGLKNGRPNGLFATCCGVLDFDINAQGNLVVANLGKHCVTTVSPAGENPKNWGKPGDTLETFCGCCNPVSVAVMDSGNIVTTEKTIPRVKVYSADGSKLLAISDAKNMPRDCGNFPVVADESGNIYALDRGMIKVFTLPK